MRKHLLLLHTANPSRKKHFERLRKENIFITLLMKNPTWEKDFVDTVIDVDACNAEIVLDTVDKIHAKHKIDAVLTFAEYSVPLAAAVSDRLNLNFVNKKAALLARDKYEMRLAYKKAGVIIPKIGVARTLTEATLIARDVGYPLIMKPIIGGGSSYVRRVDNDQELAKHFSLVKAGAWNQFKFDPLFSSLFDLYKGGILLEEYVDGGEISCESIVFQGKTTSIAIHDKPLPMRGPYFEEYFYMTPSTLNRDVQKEVYEQVSATNAALGIKIGATHSEFRITNKGPMIIETGARLGGSAVYRSVLASTGVDLVKASLDVAFNVKPDLEKKSNLPVGFVCFFPKKAGHLVGFGNLPIIEKENDVMEVQIYKELGAIIPPHTFSGLGHILFRGASSETVVRRGMELLDLASLEVEAQSEKVEIGI